MARWLGLARAPEIRLTTSDTGKTVCQWFAPAAR
jgi:hypothetical protein